MRTATILACAALAGCSGGDGSEGRAYQAEDVVRAFEAAGITLRSERLNTDDPCGSGAAFSAIAGVDKTGWACVYVGPEEGREMLPPAVLWSEREKKHRVVWVYPSEAIATSVVENSANSSFRLPAIRFTREGNVVVGYLRPNDEQRLEDALSRL